VPYLARDRNGCGRRNKKPSCLKMAGGLLFWGVRPQFEEDREYGLFFVGATPRGCPCYQQARA